MAFLLYRKTRENEVQREGHVPSAEAERSVSDFHSLSLGLREGRPAKLPKD